MSKQESIQSERPTDTDGINIGGRPELFVDHYLIDQMYGTQLKLHAPVKKEIAIAFDQPWEGPGSSAYNSVFFDGEKYRLYYRACAQKTAKEKGDLSTAQYTCLALSDDGIHWEKPELGLVEFEGSTKNNILLSGIMSHNFSRFWIQTLPARLKHGIKRLPVISLPVLSLISLPMEFTGAKCRKNPSSVTVRSTRRISASMTRISMDISATRDILPARSIGNPSRRMVNSAKSVCPIRSTISVLGSAQSRIPAPRIFCTGSPLRANCYQHHIPLEHFYTNATFLCPGAEQLYISMPMRFMYDRHKVASCPFPGVSDGVFMTSRDGVRFDRTFLEGWLRPELDERCWTQRNYITAWGHAGNVCRGILYLCQ